MLLPVVHVLLNECLIETDHTLEQINCLLAVVDFCGCELIHRLIVGLELAGLEEGDCVFD